MPELNQMLMFITSSILLALAPGPDNIFVLTQSMQHGRSAGLKITLGLCTGLLVHTSVVTLGIAAIFQTSIIAFNILKYAGAVWLLWLAFNSFRAGSGQLNINNSETLSSWALYRRGIIMNVTNPKVSLFFLAFLPQFASASSGSIRMQLIILGVLFIITTLLVFGTIAFLAGTLGQKIAQSENAGKIMNRVAGTVFGALALRLFFVQQN